MVTKEVRYTTIFEKNRASKKKTIVNVGGSGSSKSFSLAQLLCWKLVSEDNKRFVIARKTMPACKRSSYDLIIGFLKDWGVYREDRHNKTDHIYRHKNNEMLFMGLDEPTKIKSVSTGVNYVWMEEANEFTKEDFQMFALQVRRPAGKDLNHIYLSLNPIDAGNWIATDLVKKRPDGSFVNDVEVIHSTYVDNPFLGKDYIRYIEEQSTDENFYRVYALGEWGRLENLIYRNYKVIPELPEMDGAKWCYGLDFGLINPSAIIKVYLLNDRFYLEEKLYKTGLTNADIIEHFTHEEKGDIYADPSAKQMIEEIFRANLNCYEAHKDVKDGIDLCQRQTLIIPESSEWLVKEIQGYHWKKDKDGNILSEPVKLRDHLMDAMRYAIFGITERWGFATVRPGDMKPVTKRRYRF